MASKFFSFFSESKQELSRVSWPNRAELMQATVLVIVVTLLLSGLIGLMDFLLSFLVRLLIGG